MSHGIPDPSGWIQPHYSFDLDGITFRLDYVASNQNVIVRRNGTHWGDVFQTESGWQAELPFSRSKSVPNRSEAGTFSEAVEYITRS